MQLEPVNIGMEGNITYLVNIKQALGVSTPWERFRRVFWSHTVVICPGLEGDQSPFGKMRGSQEMGADDKDLRVDWAR